VGLNLFLSYYYFSGNVLYQAAVEENDDDRNKLVDGDFSTYLIDTSSEPFLRVRLKT
jgi:hypothetical protein